jgi:membrane protein required for colicin V production
MLIDIFFLILMVMAIFKGISKGFIVAVFSLFAFIIGLAAAIKLSAVVAVRLQEKINLHGYWLPVLSFLIVFVAVVLLIRVGSILLKKAVNIVFLGWVDSLAGILLYAIMYTMAYSVILFFATRIHLISAETQTTSRTFGVIEPFGPTVMSWLGKVVPFFSHMFSDLSHFFGRISAKG